MLRFKLCFFDYILLYVYSCVLEIIIFHNNISRYFAIRTTKSDIQIHSFVFWFEQYIWSRWILIQTRLTVITDRCFLSIIKPHLKIVVKLPPDKLPRRERECLQHSFTVYKHRAIFCFISTCPVFHRSCYGRLCAKSQYPVHKAT